MKHRHFHDPDKNIANVLIIYKDFQADPTKKASHVGLGNNALMTQKVLRKNGVHCDILGAANVEAIRSYLDKPNTPHYTHAFIQGLWISTLDTKLLCDDYANIHWLVRNHSQVSFLQYDSNGFKLIREQMRLQDQLPNFHVTANNTRFCRTFQEVYQNHCIYLPNLYDAARPYHTSRNPHNSRTLKIAAFGALRAQKNLATAAFAALLIGQRTNRHVEFWMNCGREGGEAYLLKTIGQMYENVPYASLKFFPWAGWDEFRLTVSTMDLLLAPTYSETFCITAADACAERVPVVGSSAVEWLPRDWMADTDDVEDVAERGIKLLGHPNAGLIGYDALVKHQHEAVRLWLEYLDKSPLHV